MSDLAPQAFEPIAPPIAASAPIEAPLPTAPADLDRAAAELAGRAVAFARTPAREKAKLLRACLPGILAAAPEMASAACRAGGVDPAGPLAGAAWLAGPVALLATVRRFAEALEDIAAGGRPSLPASQLRGRVDGRVVARLSAWSFAERALHRDADATAVFAEGVEPEDVIAGHANFYRQADPAGGVALVVASGGPPSAGPLRALDALFVEGKVAALEMGPARAHLGPLVARALGPLIEGGFLRVVHGGEVPGAHLSATLGEPRVVVGGGGGPVIVVPALYGKDELQLVARRLASEVAAGAAFDVAAPRAVVVAACWAQRRLFVELLTRAFAALPPHASPRALLPDLAPDAEPPAGAVSVVATGCDAPVELLAAAVDRCNAWSGTTTAEIVAHVIHEEDAAVAAAIDRAVVRLRAGALGVNHWPALLALRGDAPSGPWMLTQVDKAVVRAPLWSSRRPIWSSESAGGDGRARRGARLAAFQAAPSVTRLLRGARG